MTMSSLNEMAGCLDLHNVLSFIYIVLVLLNILSSLKCSSHDFQVKVKGNLLEDNSIKKQNKELHSINLGG